MKDLCMHTTPYNDGTFICYSSSPFLFFPMMSKSRGVFLSIEVKKFFINAIDFTNYKLIKLAALCSGLA